MRLKNVKGSREAIAAHPGVIHDPEAHKGSWKDVFGNNNPVRLEIGCGKGRFLTDLSRENRDINYVGVEKYSSVLIRALEKLDEEDVNIFFMRMDAENICDCFDEDEVDRLYLNFSDPWPKDRHAKRRLESRQFLARYDRILKKDGLIEFKTDNRLLFDFAVEEVAESPFEIAEITYDLHHDEKMMQGNVMTEYEEKFSSMGNPIFKYVLKRRS